MNRIKLGLGLSLIFVAAACNTKHDSGTEVKSQSTIAKVIIEPVDLETFESKTKFSGTFEASKTSALSFSIPGKVENIFVNEGDFVKQGALLASLEREDIQYTVDLSSTTLSQTEDLFQRLKKNFDEGNLSEKDFKDIQTRLKIAQIQLKQNEKRLRDTNLYAPISGFISLKSLEKGMLVSPQQVVFQLANTDPIHLKVAIPDTYLNSLTKNQVYEIEIPSIGIRAKGNLSIINPVADPGTKAFSVKFSLSNPSKHVYPGMRGDLAITSASYKRLLRVQSKAILLDAEKKPYVFVYDAKKNVAIKRLVTTGRLIDDHVEVVTGISPNESVIVGGNQKLKDGQVVKI